MSEQKPSQMVYLRFEFDTNQRDVWMNVMERHHPLVSICHAKNEVFVAEVAVHDVERTNGVVTAIRIGSDGWLAVK